MKEEEKNDYIDVRYINQKLMLTKNLPFEVLFPIIPNMFFQNIYFLLISAGISFMIIIFHKYNLGIKKIFKMGGFILKDRIILPC